MGTDDQILSIVASEQGYLASILSAEAVKASQTAHWITLISDSAVTHESLCEDIKHITDIQESISAVISSTADKEIAIAAKVAAVMGNKVGPITWQRLRAVQCPPSEAVCPRTGNVIVNGDFEDIGSDPGNPMLTGWTVVNAQPRVRNGHGASTFFSGNVVAVLGSPLVSNDASISQAVCVHKCCPYQLSFAASGTPGGPITTVTVEFHSDGISSSFTRRLTTLGSGYHTFVYLMNVPADASSATITFSKTGAGETFIDLVTFGVQ